MNHLPSWLKAFQQFLPFDPKKLCDRLELLLQEKQVGNVSIIFDEKIVAIAEKILKYKYIPTKQHKILLVNCLN